MNVYLYLDKDTALHRLDPRTKMFLLLAVFSLAFVFGQPLYTFMVLVLVLAVALLARAWENVRRMSGLLITIAVITTVLFSFTTQGETPLWGPVEREGLLYGLSIGFRLVAMIMAGLLFLSVTSNEEIIVGMVRLGIPYKFAFAVSTAIRLVPTVVGTAMVISQAQRSRGLDVESGNAFARLKKHIPIIIPVFVSTIRSTNVFSMALESKGFGAKSVRTFVLNPMMTWRDASWITIVIAILVIALLARFAGFGVLEGYQA